MTERPPAPITFLTPDEIHLVIPPECEAGVAANLRLLADHYVNLRSGLRTLDDR